MPEELYTSRDFCELAEQFEELKRENEELVSDKMHLINAAMDGVDKYRYTAHDIAYRDLERKCEALEADYVISNRELLIKQVEINRQSARIAELEAELTELKERFDITDELLKEATETIGAVVACCTYNSNDDAKIGIYGIDQKAFTRIDQFMTHYNDAISAGKVSVDVKRELTDAEIEELGAQEAES